MDPKLSSAGHALRVLSGELHGHAPSRLRSHPAPPFMRWVLAFAPLRQEFIIRAHQIFEGLWPDAVLTTHTGDLCMIGTGAFGRNQRAMRSRIARERTIVASADTGLPPIFHSKIHSAVFSASRAKALRARSRCSSLVSSILLWLMPRRD